MQDPHSMEPPGAGGDPSGPDPIPEEEEPTTTGTLFVMIVFLMALAGLWGIMYLQLLDR